ncbi:hypothetical protein [Streptomyces acidicola]|uniref:hypothetical protein n=1 Tax=Streptomyces acidicola TaxID=2596892 RepID=UPI00342A31EA
MFFQAEYALAFQIWCDDPRSRDRYPVPGEVVRANGRDVPVGDLVYSLLSSPAPEAAWMMPGLRDTLDYHRVPLREFDDDGVQRLYMEATPVLRRSGWEEQFIQDLDAQFASDPGLWPSNFNSVGARLSQLEEWGLNEANWSRIPELGAAFERHGIPVTMGDDRRVRADRHALEPPMQPDQ